MVEINNSLNNVIYNKNSDDYHATDKSNAETAVHGDNIVNQQAPYVIAVSAINGIEKSEKPKIPEAIFNQIYQAQATNELNIHKIGNSYFAKLDGKIFKVQLDDNGNVIEIDPPSLSILAKMH